MADVSAVCNYAFSVVNITESPNSHTMIDNELSVRTLVYVVRCRPHALMGVRFMAAFIIKQWRELTCRSFHSRRLAMPVIDEQQFVRAFPIFIGFHQTLLYWQCSEL